jgi:hypothetical protein
MKIWIPIIGILFVLFDPWLLFKMVYMENYLFYQLVCISIPILFI